MNIINMDKPFICECSKINWSEKFKEDYIHEDSKCKCCYSKMNRNEITYKELKEYCSIFKERNKHIYDPCTW
jgi:hypothetical protein